MTRKPRLDPKERDIQAACVQLMELDGWRAIRTDPVSDTATVSAIRAAITRTPSLDHVRQLLFSLIAKCVRGKGFGEPGMADYLFVRYGCEAMRPLPFPYNQGQISECVWVEFKRPDGPVAAHQKLWHAAERQRGGLVWVAGEDFEATVEGYWAHYRASGLLHNPSIKLGAA